MQHVLLRHRPPAATRCVRSLTQQHQPLAITPLLANLSLSNLHTPASSTASTTTLPHTRYLHTSINTSAAAAAQQKPSTSNAPSTRAAAASKDVGSGQRLTVLNVTFPPKKQIAISLTRIYGIGHSVAHDLCAQLGLNPFSTPSDIGLPTFEVLKRHVERLYQPRHIAIKEEGENILRKIRLGTYQGIRHSLALPVHGQRTRNNHKTQRKLGIQRSKLFSFPLLTGKADTVNKILNQQSALAAQATAAKKHAALTKKK